MPAIDPQDLFGDGVIWDVAQVSFPPQWILDLFGTPIGDLYTFVSDWIFPSYPDSYITSWFRPSAQQTALAATNPRAAKVSQHTWATAFDISNPDPSSYPVMAALADEWSGGPPTSANGLQGFWTAPDSSGGRAYSDGPHFHVQAFIGGGPDWRAWYAALSDFEQTYGVVA